MAKRIRRWSETTYRKYLSAKRGQGEGPSYQPWVQVQDFASKGTISRIAGRKTGRLHHFMSSGEKDYFYLLEWADDVVDIREQFPLLDLGTAIEAAGDAGIRYPRDSDSGFPFVLTCDFMISMKNGGLRARTVKRSSELTNRRTLEKLEIERRYWSRLGIDWKIATEFELPVRKIRNIEWLHASFIPPEISGIEVIMTAIEKQYRLTGNAIYQTAAWADGTFCLPAGSGLQIIKYMLWAKAIPCQINDELLWDQTPFQAG